LRHSVNDFESHVNPLAATLSQSLNPPSCVDEHWIPRSEFVQIDPIRGLFHLFSSAFSVVPLSSRSPARTARTETRHRTLSPPLPGRLRRDCQILLAMPFLPESSDLPFTEFLRSSGLLREVEFPAERSPFAGFGRKIGKMVEITCLDTRDSSYGGGYWADDRGRVAGSGASSRRPGFSTRIHITWTLKQVACRPHLGCHPMNKTPL
jgi:hypothetical protein